MTNQERIRSLSWLETEAYYPTSTGIVDRVYSLDGQVDEFILHWLEPHRLAVIDARSGVIGYYKKWDGKTIAEYRDPELAGFIDEVDMWIKILLERNHKEEREVLINNYNKERDYYR